MAKIKGMINANQEPRVLIFDIETAPIVAHVWDIWQQNIGLNQIVSDWHLLSWSAKWLDKDGIIYYDQRNKKNISDDKDILYKLWLLLDEADIVITQNGKQFDSKKVNARFAINGFNPPSPYKHIDTRLLAKKYFGFTSNKLEYLSDKLCTKFKKLKHKEFSGHDLWRECLKGNIKAWKEMEKYNKHDVLATEELYKKLARWGHGVDFNAYRSSEKFLCQCGSYKMQKRGYGFNATGKYQRYQCMDCGAWSQAKGAENNLLSKSKRKSLNGPTD